MFSYTEGTWFAVPIRQGGYAVGIVARTASEEDPIILAYFFGPKRDAVPTMEQVETLAPNSAIKVIPVSDMGIREGSWPIIGKSEHWDREAWAMPKFVRKDEIGKAAWLVAYADDDPNQVLSEKRIPYETSGYERDGLFGSGAAEIILGQILS